jgi:hypothetical protein
MEERIRDLCWELIEAQDHPEAIRDVARKLRSAIHQHVEGLRQELLKVPAVNPAFFYAQRSNSASEG